MVLAVVLLTPTVKSQTADGGTPVPNPPAAFVVPTRDKFDVYLLMGQSNMLGRDTSRLAEQVDHPNIGAMDGKGGWTVARDPMWGGSGTGPGISFAVEMAKKLPEGTKIGLVQCAVGGTPLARWVKGADLYERALARARVAARQGTLKGMLWHQGESDSNKIEDASTYAARLAQMIADFRADIGVPNLPVVVGKLGPFRTEDRSAVYTAQVNEAIAKVAQTVPYVGLADAAGLKDKGDHTHFNAESQIEFGKRYAQAMGKL